MDSVQQAPAGGVVKVAALGFSTGTLQGTGFLYGFQGVGSWIDCVLQLGVYAASCRHSASAPD